MFLKFGGSVSAMISTMKYNAGLLNRNSFFKRKRDPNSPDVYSDVKITDQEFTSKEMESFKAKLDLEEEERKVRTVKRIILSVMLTGVVIYFVVYAPISGFLNS